MQQIKFKTLTLRNFMSYGNVPTKLNLDSPGVTLILGKNGVGKTTLMNGLYYALFNKSMNKDNVDNLINYINKKNLEVTIEFEKNGINYMIERVRKGRRFDGKDTWVKLSIEGVDKTSADVEKKIEEIIGMSHDTFIRVVVISALHDPFLKLEGPKQTVFIENLFNLTMLSDKAKILHTQMKATTQSIEIIQSKIAHLEKAQERHTEQINNAQARVVKWELEKEEAIKSFEGSLSLIPKIDFEKETELLHRLKDVKDIIYRLEDQEKQVKTAEERVVFWERTHAQTVANVEKTLAHLNKIDFDKETEYHLRYAEVSDKITEIFKQQKALSDAIKSHKSTTEKHQKNLSLLHDKKCPFCLQEFADVKEKISEIESELATTQKELDALAKEMAKTEKALPALKSESFTLEHAREIPDLGKMIESRDQKKTLSQKLADLKDIANPHIEAMEASIEKFKEMTNEQKGLSELKDEKAQIEREASVQNLDKLHEIKSQSQILHNNLTSKRKAENPHYSALEELESISLEKVDYSEINTLTELLEHQQFLYKLLTKRDSFIRKAFINKDLPYLNKRLREYIAHLPFKVEFTPELTAKITRFGTEISFTSLSNGQAAAVNFGLALAFRDVNQALHPPVNICLLDEILDFGLDDETVDIASKILKNKGRAERVSMFLISHRGLSKNMFDNAIMVETDKDFSIVKQA
jgi:DNA repair exonuclease SbcCD ATPase subunit